MKNRFEIGDWVIVTAKVSIDYIDYDKDGNQLSNIDLYTKIKNTRRVIISKEINPIVGKVVGMAARMKGDYYSGNRQYSYNGEYDYEPGYLSNTKVIYVWLVRTGMLNKQIEVLDSDISLHKGKKDFPLKYMPPWSDDLRKAVSIDSKDYPRDKKGRWT